MQFRTLLTLLVLAATVAPIPAAAQYYPPRPPRDVDTGPDNQPPPQQYPQQYPPSQQYPPPSQPYPRQGPPQYPPSQGGVQSAPLPPPPGAGQPYPPPGGGQALPQQALPQQGQQRMPAQKGVPGTATIPDPNAPPQPAQKAKQKAAKLPPPPADQPGQPEAAEVPVQQEPIHRISNPTAVFSGLDKITGRIINFEVAMDETVQFGALQVTPHVCYTRAATEIQNTTSFVDVDEITLQGDIKRIFTGWMFANSPGLHGVEHPIYDVWVTDCKTTPPAMAASGGKK